MIPIKNFLILFSFQHWWYIINIITLLNTCVSSVMFNKAHVIHLNHFVFCLISSASESDVFKIDFCNALVFFLFHLKLAELFWTFRIDPISPDVVSHFRPSIIRFLTFYFTIALLKAFKLYPYFHRSFLHLPYRFSLN
jgi:hypothetical protein